MHWVLPLIVVLTAAATGARAEGPVLSGTATGGFVLSSDNAGTEVTALSEIDMRIAGAGQSDGGLTFGAFLEIDEKATAEAEVFLSGAFGTFSVGTVDPATDGFGIADPGFSGLGIDDIAEQFRNATTGADVAYTFSQGGFTLRASAEIGGAQSLGVAAEYASGSFRFGLGYADDTDAANSAVSVTAGYSFGAVAVGGLYSDWSGGGQGYGLDVTVDTGPATVTAVWAQSRGVEADPEAGVGEAYGIGLTVPLSGGLSLSGGLGRIDTDALPDGPRTVADFGVTMSF